jgi:hypothetical protein
MKKLMLIISILLSVLLITACQKESADNTTIPDDNNENTAPSVPETPQAPIEPIVPVVASFSEPIPNIKTAEIDALTNSVTVEFKNNVPNSITLPLTGTWARYSATYCKTWDITSTYKKDPVEPLVTTIQSGDSFIVKWTCTEPAKALAGSNFSADLTFNYKNAATGMIKTQSGTITGQYS